MNRGVSTKLVHASSMGQSVRDSVFCKYSHRDCTQNCIEGYDFCIRHILEDKTAPYRQCAYITKGGRKCPAAAPKLEKKEGYCSFHTKKGLISRQRLARKRRLKETPDSLLEDLVVTTSAMESNHFVEHRRGKMHSDSVASRALDYASSSDSEAEPLLVEHAWRDSGDSDAESIDSDQEDILKYAGVYTTEEVAQVLRDKLIRLQALYIDQFKRLKHILFTKRRKYLQAQKTENDLYGSIKRYKEDPHQKEKYEKLCAMKRYHRKFGVEALMQCQSTRRRIKITDGSSHKLPNPVQCGFVDEGMRCSQTVVPLSKYCQKHILHDQNQVLYRPCPFADSQCGRPVPSLLGSPFCSLHQSLPSTSGSNVPEEIKLEGGVTVKHEAENREMSPVMVEVKQEKTEEHYGNVSEHKILSPIEERVIKVEDVENEEEGSEMRKGVLHRQGGIKNVINNGDSDDDDDDDDDDEAHGLR